MSRGSTTERGYGYRHQRKRRRLDREIQKGGVNCVRCGKPIQPGEPWDLGHDDRDRSITRGPEHRACNRATAAHRPTRTRPDEEHPGLLD